MPSNGKPQRKQPKKAQGKKLVRLQFGRDATPKEIAEAIAQVMRGGARRDKRPGAAGPWT